MQPVGLGGALGDELVAVVAEHLEVLGLPGVAGGWEVVLSSGDARDRQCVGREALMVRQVVRAAVVR